jgi:predicted DNA-binding antitoxin AbrB/MazE fold protein
MKTQIKATFKDGHFTPDENLSLAEGTRVNLTVEVLDEDEADLDEEFHGDPAKSRAALQSLRDRLKKRPIHGGKKKYTRDELYERR